MSLKSILSLLCYFPILVFSQNIQIGIKGGLNLSHNKFETFSEGIPIPMVTEIEPSYHVGALFEFYKEDQKVRFQMEVMYTGNGTNVRESDLTPEIAIKVNQIAVPLLAKLEATEDWSFTTGTYFGYLINAIEKNRFGERVDSKTNFQFFDFGLLIGFELRVNTHLAFDLRYNYGLLNFNNSILFSELETERIYKNRTVNYGVVYKF